ncbi:MAG: hypothetical protein K2G75_05790, partial [Muribaculaceae bacterium]|nr:hypothetical protein [Muribaculaceae bacterium]
MNTYLIIFALLSTSTLAASGAASAGASEAAEDSVENSRAGARSDRDIIARWIAETHLAMKSDAQAFANPALMPLRRDYSLAQIAAGWRSRRESEPFVVEAGDGSRDGFFEAEAYFHNGASTLWGDAAYSNGRNLNQRWNESGDFDRLYPYLTADSVGGDLNRERYSFAGGYARTGSHIVWGVEGSYTAVLAYRKVDPRPRDITGDLRLKGGVGYRFPFGYTAAVGVGFDKFRQTSSISFMSELGVSKIYHLTGLGSHYYRFAGTGYSTYNDCYEYSLSANIIPQSATGAFLNAEFSLTTQRHVIDDLNRLPMASLTHREMNLSGGWNFRFGAHSLSAEAAFDVWRRHGRENIFGDSQSGTFPQIGSLDMFADNYHCESLRIVYEAEVGSTTIGIAPYGNLTHRRTVYITPRRDRLMDMANAGLRARATRRVSTRLAGSLSADYSRRFHRNSLLTLPASTDPQTADLDRAVTIDYENATCGADAIQGGINLAYAISSRYALALSGNIGYV